MVALHLEYEHVPPAVPYVHCIVLYFFGCLIGGPNLDGFGSKAARMLLIKKCFKQKSVWCKGLEKDPECWMV